MEPQRRSWVWRLWWRLWWRWRRRGGRCTARGAIRAFSDSLSTVLADLYGVCARARVCVPDIPLDARGCCLRHRHLPPPPATHHCAICEPHHCRPPLPLPHPLPPPRDCHCRSPGGATGSSLLSFRCRLLQLIALGYAGFTFTVMGISNFAPLCLMSLGLFETQKGASNVSILGSNRGPNIGRCPILGAAPIGVAPSTTQVTCARVARCCGSLRIDPVVDRSSVWSVR